MSDYAHVRMLEWARWYAKSEDGGLGYRAGSIEAELIDSGTLIRGTGARPSPVNEPAEQVEAGLKDMARTPQCRALADAMRAKYHGVGTDAGKARGLGVSESTFKSRVKHGLWWMDAYLRSH